MHDFFRRRRLGTIAVAALALAVSGGLAIASVTAHAAGNAPTPYAQCPAIGSSPSCEILLVVNPNNSQPSDSTGLVTLSVGGNDVGFPFVMQACVNGFRNETTDSGCLAVIKTELGLGAKLLKQGGTILLNTQDNSYVFCDKACVAQFLSQGKKNKNSHLQVVTVPSLAGLYADVHQRAPQAEIRVLLYPHLSRPVRPRSARWPRCSTSHGSSTGPR